jgi:hypothetical protein
MIMKMFQFFCLCLVHFLVNVDTFVLKVFETGVADWDKLGSMYVIVRIRNFHR